MRPRRLQVPPRMAPFADAAGEGERDRAELDALPRHRMRSRRGPLFSGDGREDLPTRLDL